ncbi:hypothetical protein NCU06072 [Neurospora crassa OR74A]|uniref:Clr5 domain-containing protein n=1 Tax=Neurospora crassa (strain ATCC 24698 / 74-OR23-1A / CBS 708.71 / DSM 1257 / FGSC 987) TaxID=367110 RepID=Q7S4X8_NEUCR|nr:hypothetical protein NCU06072 [Neurospora crassa OR74A]EAA30599.3 hypothetical protein NCU06072 [Neurospora crassa OR74A]|eukprot:XP_959835.3 hypothetical protein NCU06072 [Neurospora crassa OR74A]
MEGVRHDQQQQPPGWAGGDEWEEHRGRIQELYQSQNLSLKEVMRIMEEHCGFRATQRMYKTRIKAWGLDKNFKESEVVELFRLRREREKLGKPTTYRIRGREIDWDRVNNYVKRKGLDIARLLEADRPRSPAVAREITCRTPSPISGHHRHYQHEPLASTPSLSSSAGSDHYTHNVPPFTKPMTASSAPIMAGMDARTTNSTPYPAYTQSYSPTQALRSPATFGHSETLPPVGHSVAIHSFQRFLTRIYKTLLYEDNDKTWGTTQYWLGYSHALEWLMTIRYKTAFYRDILVQLSSDSGGGANVSIAARDIVRRFRTINRSFAMLEPMVQSVIGAKFYYIINFVYAFGLCADVAQLPVAYPLVSIARVLLDETHNACSAPHPLPVLPGGLADGGRPGEMMGIAYQRSSCSGVANGGGRAAAAAAEQEGFMSAAGYDADYYLSLSHPPYLNVNSSSNSQPIDHHHHSDTSASASRRLMFDSSSHDFKDSAERFLNTVLEQTVKDLGVSPVSLESFLLLRDTMDGRPILGPHIPFPASSSPSAPLSVAANANVRRPAVEVPEQRVFNPNPNPSACPSTNNHHPPPPAPPLQDQEEHRQKQDLAKKLLQEATSHLKSAIWLLSHGKDAQAESYLSSVITTTENLLSASSSTSTSSLESQTQSTSGSGSSEIPFPSVSLKMLLRNDSSSSSSSMVTKTAKVIGRCAHYHLARLYGRRIRAGGWEGTGMREKEREHLIKSTEGTALFDEYVQWEEVEFLF